MSESFNPAWRTQEPPKLVSIEKIIVTSTLLGMMAYGAHVVVYLTSLHAVLTTASKRNRILQSLFVTSLFAFATLYIVRIYQNLVFAFVEYRSFPGGPAAFYPIITSLEKSRYDYGNFSAVIVTWLSDAMLIWRCFTVWSKRWIVIILPILMWIGSVVTGSITCYEAARPKATLESLGAFNFNLSFWAISISLNMLLTALIMFPLLRARAQAGAILGKDHGKVYLGIAAIMIESALLYAVVGFAYIATYGVNSLDGLTLLPTLVQIEAIAPELLIFRIAHGRAWTSTTGAQLTSNKPEPLRFTSTSATSRTAASRTVYESQGDISMVKLEGAPKSDEYVFKV